MPEHEAIAPLPQIQIDHEAIRPGSAVTPTASDKLNDALVMMVDDEPTTLEVTRVCLEDAGYSRFVLTDTPTNALEQLESERPDLMVSKPVTPDEFAERFLAVTSTPRATQN